MSVFNGKAENIEDNRNKTNKIIEADETKYPSCKAVVDYVNENVEIGASVNYVNNNFANALKGYKTAKGYDSLVLDDISPIEHELKIKVMSKNLVKYPYGFTEVTKYGITFKAQADGGVKISGTLVDVEVNGTNVDFKRINVSHLVGKTLCINHNDIVTGALVYGHLYYNDGTSPTYSYYRSNETSSRVKVIPENASYIVFGVGVMSGTYDTVVYPQLEIGTAPTEYSPYVNVADCTLIVSDGGEIEYETTKRQYCTINEDGTVDGAKSYYPITDIWVSAEGETFTEVEYNRDLNKAFEETLNRLAALEAAIVNS
jgi:hypothetical protein